MDVKSAYNIWSEKYDRDINLTRDLEVKALKITLSDLSFSTCLEIGCGTGKNTSWLLSKSKKITAIDLSPEMLLKAKAKINSKRVNFLEADISKPWRFIDEQYDFITFSLVLEHIKTLDNIFKEAAQALIPGGYIYIGELHPFKQYLGSKARFETGEGLEILSCFIHNISDFTLAVKQNGLNIISINEFFDNDDRISVPRILTLLLKKNNISS